VGQHFLNDNDDDDVVTRTLSELVQFDNRNWNTIQLSSCRGRMDLILEAVLASNVTVRRLVLSDAAPEGGELERFWSVLRQGLQSNTSLLTLGLQDMKFHKSSQIDRLCRGLAHNTSVMELSFNQSTFLNGAHSSLAQGLQFTSCIQHLSFQNCRLTDEQCAAIITSLVGHTSLLELSLDGNQCHTQGMNALARMLPQSNVLVLDLSSQTIVGDQSSSSLDLTQFSKALPHSRISCLQLSDNRINDGNMRSLAQAIACGENHHQIALQTLHLAWCQLSSVAMEELSKALACQTNTNTNASSSKRRRNTIRRLILYECEIDDEGISNFSSRLSLMSGLKRLDLGGTQTFGKCGIERLMLGLETNMELEDVLLGGTFLGDETNNDYATTMIGFYCDLNRAGRRFLRSKHTAPAALWPLILSQVQSMDLPSTCDDDPCWAVKVDVDPQGIRSMEDNGLNNDSGGEESNNDGNLHRNGMIRRASVLFYLLRNGAALLEM
jgi:hypothetical protein